MDDEKTLEEAKEPQTYEKKPDGFRPEDADPAETTKPEEEEAEE